MYHSQSKFYCFYFTILQKLYVLFINCIKIVYLRWQLLIERFDQMKAAGDLLPMALASEGE